MKLRELRTTDKAALRKFGLVIAVPLALIGAYLLWNEHQSGIYFLIISGISAITGLAYPKILKPLYFIWMTLARLLSFVTTFIILTIFFFIVITPIALIMRLFRKDLLSRKFPGGKNSYWVDAHSYPDEIERYSKPF